MSKIHTKINLSDLHSKHGALSHPVRELLPLESITKEAIDNLGIDSEKLKFVSISTIYY